MCGTSLFLGKFLCKKTGAQFFYKNTFLFFYRLFDV